jgi:acetyl esterase
MLDSETEDLLNGPLRAVGGKPTVEALRQINLELGRTLGGAPEPVAAIEDRAIDVDGRSLRVRVYRPDSYAPLPVILYCHGGGFVWGEPEGYDFLSRALAKECGALLLALDYRLAPEHPYPAALEDVEAGLRWTFENAERLGGDADRVAIAGDSAGGTLAAVIAQRSRQSGRKLAAQMLLYPVLDATMSTRSYDDLAEGYYLTRSAMAWY